MASFTGMFNTSNFTTDLAKKSFAGMITRLMPNGSAPLFGLTSMLPSETAVQVEHGFFAKTALFPSFTLDASVAAADTTFTVVSTANILPGMIFRASTAGVVNLGENVIVNSVLSATQLTVSRAQGTVAAGTSVTAGFYAMVGNAFEEGSVRPNALNVTPVRVTNFTQIFRNSWAITDTVRATLVIAGDSNVAESKQDCAAFHAADIEKALFFGQKSSSTRNGQPFRTMAGLQAAIVDTTLYPAGSSANTTIAGATTTYTQLETALNPVFDQATDPKVANERIMFVGGTAKLVLNNIGRLNGTYMMVDGATTWGLQFSTFKTARGTFRVIEHPLFNTNAIWAKMAMVVDLSTFSLAYLGDRKTQSADFTTDNDDGVDAVGGTLTTELTTVIRNPAANAIITGLTAGATG
jgi:hypothetical protein